MLPGPDPGDDPNLADLPPSEWSGIVDTINPAGRGRGMRVAYEDIPNTCADMDLFGVPRRYVGVKFWVKPHADVTDRDRPYYLGWEEGIPLLRDNYATISINAEGHPHVVYASREAARAAAAAMKLADEAEHSVDR